MNRSDIQPKISVAVLGATGSVGQRFVSLLDGHPWFEVVALTGSDRKAGRPYGEACQWVLPNPMPTWSKEMILQPSDPQRQEVRLAFSGLPTRAARELEPQFAAAGVALFSNASAFRADPDVPLLMPEVNADHLGLIPFQQEHRGWPGFIVTNPNCTSAGVTVTLQALELAFGVQEVFLVSMQALSGAGIPGVPSLEVIDNVIPYIGGEEEKVETEPLKMMGRFAQDHIEHRSFRISAQCNRVAVSDGHTACLSVALGHAPASIEEVQQVLASYAAPVLAQGLPSTPAPVIEVMTQENRPQPRLDRMTGQGMTTVVGRLRPDPILDLRMVVLSHNTIRGAAGGSIYNAELAVNQGYLD